MERKIWLVFLLLLGVGFCNSKSALEQANEMAKAYDGLTSKYNRLNDQINAKMKDAGNRKDLERVLAEYNRIMTDKNQELTKLLQANENSKTSAELELLRSKIMIEIGRFADADQIIDRLIVAKSKFSDEAKLQKVFLHLLQRRNADALTLFREIEKRLKKDNQFFRIYLALAFNFEDANIRKEYSLKFLDSSSLPAEMQLLQAKVYANLANLAKDDRQTDRAIVYLKKALSLNSDPAMKSSWEAEIKHLSLLDQPAPPLDAETWINSTPLSLAELKGKVAVIDFWAPWCAPCRVVMPTLLDEYRKLKNQGLVVIGYTRLYGRYSDDVEKKDPVSAAEELALLKKYIIRNKITYPIAVAAEGRNFDSYAITAIPSLVFINRRGNIVHIKTGSGNTRQITDKIKSLLEEK